MWGTRCLRQGSGGWPQEHGTQGPGTSILIELISLSNSCSLNHSTHSASSDRPVFPSSPFLANDLVNGDNGNICICFLSPQWGLVYKGPEQRSMCQHSHQMGTAAGFGTLLLHANC